MLYSLRSSEDAREIVAQLQEILHLDLGSLENPDPATKLLIRDLATKAKQEDRLDVFERLREILPAGTTGESFFPRTKYLCHRPHISSLLVIFYLFISYIFQIFFPRRIKL